MMCRAHGTNVGEQKCIQGFGYDLKERDHLANTGIGISIILKWILKKLNALDLSSSGLDNWKNPVTTVDEPLGSLKCTNLSIISVSPNTFHCW
jgi:hypothetical protein